MALKYELEQWGAAVKAYDEQDFDLALDTFETIADSAKFHFNMGLIYATLGEHEEACRSYKKSVKLDQYFAVAYFQKGVSHFLLGEFEKALANFNDALLYLRGNMLIDYEQLGLKFRLYSCEVLFNRGLCYLYLGQTDQGLGDFSFAVKEKQTEEHDVIDEAIEIQGKLKNVKTKDYLGKAKLVAAVDPDDAFTGFTGAQQQKKAQMSTTSPINKGRTDGAVLDVPRPESPTEKTIRPRSLSTNPKSPPFPIRTTRELSTRRRPEEGIENKSIMRTGASTPLLDTNGSTELDTPISRNVSLRKAPPNQLKLQNNHHRSNTIDGGRPSPKLPTVPARVNPAREPNRPTMQRSSSLRDPMGSSSLREPITRSNSLRTVSPRGGVRTPQRLNTVSRQQYLQQQMKNMTVTDGGYNDYNQESEKYSLNSEDFSQISSSEQRSGRSPSIRSRGSSIPSKGASFRSPLSMQGGLATPPTPEDGDYDYSNIVDDGYLYGDEDEPQFEMISPPKNFQQSKIISKIRVKCYYKDKTPRAIMVPTNIAYEELSKRIQEKFSLNNPLKMKYKDEDGTMVMMGDQEDLEMALSIIPMSTSDVGKMEVWIEE
ncbi:13277_t:CDS:10 [Cetraspora pellucida]|uniref:13277_t:CDS:1 n=1 Tax=Cetraspora pellucida TaxID=1433469 RepID=A0A9N9G6C6_9GLOM|nr:13277_t:CDS:10 [Cetraspora pellucida]